MSLYADESSGRWKLAPTEASYRVARRAGQVLKKVYPDALQKKPYFEYLR